MKTNFTSMKKLIKYLTPMAVLILSPVSYASMIYTYTGPNYPAYTYNGTTPTTPDNYLAISFETTNPLAPSTSYLSLASAGVTNDSVTVENANNVPLPSFSLPITTFQVHTNAAGAIDSWYIFGEAKSLAGSAPTMTGTDIQAYSMNTLTFIPGSNIQGAVGLVTGHYAYDQATVTTFYTLCAGISGCVLAGDGQPYVSNYSGIINPSNTGASNWVSASAPVPLPAAAWLFAPGLLAVFGLRKPEADAT